MLEKRYGNILFVFVSITLQISINSALLLKFTIYPGMLKILTPRISALSNWALNPIRQ